ncbi:MAG: ABC transporter substrate-binding protein [Usitatibacter sp.]
MLKRFFVPVLLLLLPPLSAIAQQPTHYPASYAQTIAAAKKEGRVVIYGVLGNRAAKPLIDDFRALYPGIEVAYDGDQGSNEAQERYLAEVKKGAGPDVMWSSAMDLQLKLVEDGHAMTYRSAEAAALPGWANYRDQAYGSTFEPVVFIYNKKELREDEVPRDHVQFARLLAANPARYRGKVTTFDIEKSGVGFMFAVQDRRHHRGLEDLANAMGKVDYRPTAGTGPMLDKVASGEYLLGYNVMGAYAMVRAKREPTLGVVLPQDYTLVLSRVAFISKHAKHPNAAKLWLDHLLSMRGQKVIGDALELFAIRTDVDARYTAASLSRELGPRARPISIDGDLALTLDPSRRNPFIKRWNEAVEAGRKQEKPP